MSAEPLVSICCLTYNHASFIKACLDGFLAQKTDFPIEILVHDDASTDGTDAIIRDYAERYPQIIYPLYEDENQYSKGMQNEMDIVYNYARARGKYIATCEGDDYWTDPLKLQKQVDFLEEHPDYSVCFHRCEHLHVDTGTMTKDGCGRHFRQGKEGVDISLDMFFESWVTQPLTMMFRKSMFSASWQKRYRHYRDMHEIYHLLSAGKGYLMSFEGGVYRFHEGGIMSQIGKEKYCEVSLPIDREFYRKTKDIHARKVYLETLSEAVKVCAGKNKRKAFRWAAVRLLVSGDLKVFVKNIRLLLHG